MTLDPMLTKMADVNGYVMQNDFGVGRSRGRAVQVTISNSSSNRLNTSA